LPFDGFRAGLAAGHAAALHAAEVVVSTIGGLILLVGGVIAWLVNTNISTHPAK